MRRALTIAGSDSGGGAGIQADLKTFAAFGLYGTSAITAITAQNTLGISSTFALSADVVVAQIEAIASDVRLDATKIGMLATAAIVEAVAATVQELDLPSVVLDPVLVSSTGERLLDEDGVQTLRLELLPRARVVTPNILEAEVLSGGRITSDHDMRRAAERLHSMGAGAVVITGGPARSRDDVVVDLFYDGTSFMDFQTTRVAAARGMHGTGCTYASALAAGLALGETLASSAARAQQYVAGAIAHGAAVGQGAGVLDHFWQGVARNRRG